MAGFLGTRAGLASDLNLLLQIVILIILFVGAKFGKTKTAESLKRHGRLMTVVVVLNAVGIVAVMLPSFASNFSAVLEEPLRIGFPLTSIHAFFGGVAEILGVMFVFKKFGNVRLWMRFTMVVWLIAIILGISFYLTYYVI